jgi:AcrR family transcriptional regulator
LIVDAARDVLSERGLDAPLEEVAQRAGVGIATLYRRFPTRADLVTAVFEKKMTAYNNAIDAALSHEDPWLGFCDYVRAACGMQAEDAGFADVLSRTFPTSPALEKQRRDGFRKFARLVRRAKESGGLRRDFVSQDMVMFLMANAGVVHATHDTSPAAWERFVGYVLGAVHVPGNGVLPLSPPPRPAQMFRAMQQAAGKSS